MAGPPVDALRTLLDTIRHRAAAAQDETLLADVRAAVHALDSIDRHLSAATTVRSPRGGGAGVDMLQKAVHETNTALEQKIEELSLLRLMTDATSRAVRATDPFRLLLDKIVKMLKADNGSIMLVDWTTKQLVVRTASGQRDNTPHMPRFDLGEGVAGQVAQTGRPLVIEDVAAEARYVQLPGRSMQEGSLLCFPLTVQGQTIGVINLSSPRPHTFTNETTRIAHIIAGQLAVAIENSRLYGEIKETKDYLENLVERAGAAIFTLDPHGLVDSWNAGAREMYQLPAREVTGRGMDAFITEADLQHVQQAIDVVIHDGGVVTLQAGARRGDGKSITTDLTLSPIRDSRGQIVGISGIGKDISEQKRIEDELRSLNEAKSNFISMVSHELRTPLTSVKSFVEIMTDTTAPTPPETQQRYLRIINEECDRLDKLISDLLNLQKAAAGGFELDRSRVILAEVVAQAIQLYAPVAERRHIDLIEDIRDTSPPGAVEGDRDKLYQVLGNLLNNAMKFTPEGGQVTVHQDTVDSEIRVTVVDTGPGIPDQELGRVFERFYQVDNSSTRKVEGTGLGLSICREIVETHGGRIWADSAPDRGATFGIRLPRLLGPTTGE